MHQLTSKKFVYFDMGNVLVHFDHEIAVEQLARLTDKPASAIRRLVFEEELQNRYETGLISGDQFVSELGEKLDLGTLAADSVLEAISAIFTPNEEIEPVLQDLKGRGISMGILSNTCQAHWDWLKRQGWSVLGDWFDSIILSYEAKSMKPGDLIYEVSEARAGAKGAQLFFTDDRGENVEAARRRGWETYQFGTVSELTSRLKNWLEAEQ